MNRRTLRVFVFCLLQFLFCFSILPAQFYRGSQQDFGKNRVQYNDFLWTFYRFKNFDVYFYLGGQELAAFTGKSADKEIEDIEHLFDYKTSGRLQFMVFNKLSDLKQSNIGLEDLQSETGNIGGVTRIIGNKILIYYDGNHEHFRQQIRAGVSKVLIEQLMYGGNIKDRVQSAVLLNLPAWYTEGLVSYISSGWTAADDNKMRDGILAGKYRKFNRMLDNEEIFAGHSLWNFVVESYGPGVVANLLYMTRINRNIESGFIYVLGASLTELSRQWLDFYQKQYLNADKNRVLPTGDPVIAKPKNNRRYSQAKFSPDGMTLAYVTNDIGKYRVWLYERNTKKRKCILKGGYKSLEQKNDLSFPVLAWHPSADGQMLSVMREKKGLVYLDNYSVSSKKTVRSKFFYFEKVLDFSYSHNGQQMVLSGVQKGQSDIYIYDVRARTSRQITKDIYDDLNPRFVMGSKFIVFSSNRITDTLSTEKDEAPPSSHFDIFLYEQFGRSQVLKRATHTPWADEIQPLALDSSRFAFLSDESGIFNRYTASVDSVISFIDTTEHYRYVIKTFPQTNYTRNIEEHDLNFKKTAFAEIIYSDGRYKIFTGGNPSSGQLSLQAAPGITPWYDKKQRTAGVVKSPAPVNTIQELGTDTVAKRADENISQRDSGKIDINDYVFQSEFPRKKKKIQDKVEASNKATQDTAMVLVISPAAAKSDTVTYRLPKQRNYDPAFSADYFIAQLDNSLLNSTYQTFTGGAVYFDPGLTGLFKIGISDLMNDYKITAGFRLAGDLNSNEYLLSFEDLKRKIDKQYIFYRQAREFTIGGFYFIKVHTHEAKYVLKYPFNDLASLRGTISYRNDRTVIKSTDIFALQIPNFFEHWASAKLEYVYDNTIKKGLNLYNGMRYKFFAEGFRQVDQSKTFMGVVGVDFRHYLKIHRQIVWANRFAASSSFGDLKLIYYLGSQDNSIVPVDNFNYNIDIDTSQNYAFQTLATPLRGFIQNIRNGNNFAIVNSELRIPIFQYLIRRPIRSDFIRNFQIITFADFGTAWTGRDPYSKDNSLNTEIIPGKPITVILRKQIEPVVAGYGFGIRSRIFGYYLKGDWAWGYEDGRLNESIFYLTLGLDF